MANKITPRDPQTKTKITVSTQPNKVEARGYKWWHAKTKKEKAEQVVTTASFLKDYQQYRYRQASVFSRLYGNIPLMSGFGSNMSRLGNSQSLPVDRPTMNVVQSCIDTLVSRISQSRPRPVFLTDNSDYRERRLAKQLNNFITGELFQTKAYELGEFLLRDAAVLGTGCVKIYESDDNRVALERVLYTELLVDPNEALYGSPRQLYQFKLVDRDVVAELFPEKRSDVMNASQATPEAGNDNSNTVSDQIILVEAWHLPSGKNASDGMHVIACSSGLLMEEEYTKTTFPFEFLHYSPRMLGFWGQGLAEQLMGTQVEINKLLMTISRAINLVGVPRVFVEVGSKVVKAHLNDQIGAIVTYSGTKPVYEVAPCIPQEVYAQLQRLVEYAYQQSGVSALSAAAQKPAGLNSGEAIRNYNDLQSDRFASLSRRYDEFYVKLAYQITGLAKEIAERDGKYQTVYPNKNGAKEIDLPAAKLLDDPFVIQCYDANSLPKEPAGRLQKVTELAQAGMIDMNQARRLLDFPDLQQVDTLNSAPEERILKALDDIVEDGKYTPPDETMDLQKAKQLCLQYINLYVPLKLEGSKEDKLRDFLKQIQAIEMAAEQPAAPQDQMPQQGDPGAQPTGVPQAPPTSDLLPTMPQ
jgi:hypothetical protein